MWQETNSLRKNIFQNRLNQLWFFIMAVFLVLSLRLFLISIVKGSYFHKVSEDNRIQIFPEPAPRGIIYDRTHKVMVDNRLSFSVMFVPLNLNKQEAELTIERLDKVIGVDKSAIHDVLAGVCIAEDIDKEKVFFLSEQKSNYPGMKIQVQPRRHYPYGPFAAHLLGYLGEITKKEMDDAVESGFKLGDIVGRTGLEKMYDSYLRGIDGSEQIEVNVNGRPVRVLNHQPSHMGDNIGLTINRGLQETCESLMEGKKGAICVLNPRNGEILALVSKPDFDPNIFVGHTTPEQYKQLFNNKDLPMFNRVIQSQQSPGSTFKIITTIAALEKKAIDTETTFHCNGKFYLGSGSGRREFKCWKKEGHGTMKLIDAIAQSCDVYFYQVGLRAGVDNIAEYASMLGLSNVSGFGFPGEEKGLIPTSKWKKEKYRDNWYPGDTVNMCIGQGYVLVTPIQMANLISIVANRGTLYKPFVVREIVDYEGNRIETFNPSVMKRATLSPQTWDILEKGLKEAVLSGTCQVVKFKDLSVAAKTGTAQNPHGPDHAWFVCYAPVGNPQVAIAVYVEHGGHGASGAGPIARRILERVFGLGEEDAAAETFTAED